MDQQDNFSVPPWVLEIARRVRDVAGEVEGAAAEAVRRLEAAPAGRAIEMTIEDTLGLTDTVTGTLTRVDQVVRPASIPVTVAVGTPTVTVTAADVDRLKAWRNAGIKILAGAGVLATIDGLISLAEKLVDLVR